jgi:hypothetical protein
MTASFYSSVIGPSADATVVMKFSDRAIPRPIFERFAKVCRENISFGEIDAEQLLLLLNRARIALSDSGRERASAGAAMDIRQAQSIRRHVIRQYNISNTHRAARIFPRILKEYNAGRTVLELSARQMLSPYVIFKNIAEAIHGVGARERLNSISLGKIRASDVFDERTAREYEAARAYDYESTAVQLEIARLADGREHNFVSFLRDDLGIRLRTQEESLALATRDGTHPITPDALFLSRVEINGERAHWVDFKSYCGAPFSFLLPKAREQSEKYDREFGPGFMVYENGYVDGMPFRAVSARALRDIIEGGMRRAILV